MNWFKRKEAGQGACQSWLVAYCCNVYLKITKSIETDPIGSVGIGQPLVNGVAGLFFFLKMRGNRGWTRSLSKRLKAED